MINCPVDNCNEELRDKRGLHSHLRTHNLNRGEIHAKVQEVEPQPAESKYPDDWQQRRHQVLRRDDYRCQQCGDSKDLHVHHQTPISQGGNHKLENLTTLCQSCHSSKHPENSLLQRPDEANSEQKSIHHEFRKQLMKEYGISYTKAKKYDHLHDQLLQQRVDEIASTINI